MAVYGEQNASPLGGYAEAPGPHHILNHLIESTHAAIAHHPSAAAKSDLGNILARLLARQAKTHAASDNAAAHGLGGGPQDTGQGVPAQQPGSVISSLTGGAGGGPAYYGQPSLGVTQEHPAASNAVVEALAQLPQHQLTRIAFPGGLGARGEMI